MEHSVSKRWIITGTVVMAALLELIDTTVVNVSLPQIMGNLGATLADVGWVVTAYAIANVIILPMSGWLGARFGRRNYFVFSIIIFTISSFFCGNADNILQLILFRFIQGVGGGALLGTAQAILIETWPKEKLGMATAIFGLGVVIGPTLGPTLGGYITDHFSWPWVFYVNLPLGVIAVLLAVAYIPPYPATNRSGAVDWWGILFLTTGVGCLQFVLERGETEDWFETEYIIWLTFIAFVGLVAFVVRELSIDHPVVNLRILKNRSLAIGMITTFILGFGLFGSVFVFPVFCQSLLGFSAQQTGMLLIPGGLCTIFMMPMIGKMLQKGVPPQILSTFGFFFFFLFTWLMSKSTLSSGQSDFYLPLIFRGIGLSLLFVPLTTLALSSLEPKDIGQGTGLNNMMRQLGGSFGVAIITTTLHLRQGLHRSRLLENVTPFDPETSSRLAQMKAGMLSKGMTVFEAQQASVKAMEGVVVRQSYLLSYMDAFWLTGVFFLFCIPLLYLQKFKRRSAVPSLRSH
ncbi:MAG: DHA2 family efflux MFS transporter permease subunit [Bacteroidota bacterium]